MGKRLIYAEDAIEALCKAGCESGYCGISCDDVKAIEQLPSAQPQDIARDIATIIENEKDMRVILKNAQPERTETHTCVYQRMETHEWIPVTKEEMLKAGYEGREIRFRVDGRLFAIRELAQ